MNIYCYICTLIKLNKMKEDVFNQYVERVSSLFNVSREELFSKSKKREIVDARHLIYYLCHKRPMRLSYIQKYMIDNNYSICHSSIIHGINVMTTKVQEDRDYKSIVQDIDKAVFI